MKKIDLKKYYPSPELYEESNIVLVSDDVADVMEQSLRDEKSYFMRRYRAKAYYSLDYQESSQVKPLDSWRAYLTQRTHRRSEKAHKSVIK